MAHVCAAKTTGHVSPRTSTCYVELQHLDKSYFINLNIYGSRLSDTFDTTFNLSAPFTH
jgi:hypothetical protein